MWRSVPEKYTLTAALLFCLCALHGQQVLEADLDRFNAFNQVENGWCASDATISLLLPDSATLWLFGDCIVGTKVSTFDVNDANATMINNAAVIEDNGVLRAYFTGTWQDPGSLIPSVDGDIFWPEHATVENDTLKIFAVRIIMEDTGVPGFNFRVGTTHLARFTYPGMEHIRTDEVSFITDSTMRFGTHVLEEDGFKYIFGKKDTVVGGLKYPVPMLARVDSTVDEPWQFYAGEGNWTYDCRSAVPVGDRPMSESFFVHKMNGKYYLIMHEIWLIGELFILEADALTGPWNRAASGGIEKKFAVINSPEKNFTYNLFAHPQFGTGDDLLISFNVNNSDFWPIYDDTRHYRARFYRMDVEEALRAAVPDTLDIWADFTGTGTGTGEGTTYPDPAGPHVWANGGILHLEDAGSPRLLEIFGADGKLYLSRRVQSDEKVSLEGIPETVLLVRLSDRHGAVVRRIVNMR